MFIKKDLRKIPEILEDDKDEREELKLAKRVAEFKGNINILSISKYSTTALTNLKILNLYDNHIKSLEGIGGLEVTPITEMNLGGNDLNHLPFEFGRLKTLRSLWLDDNSFEDFPSAICQLENLDSLRFSSNQLAALPPMLSNLKHLTTLALDNNLFVDFPQPILLLPSLKHLWLRQNKIRELPEELTALQNLETLSASSNEISVLPTLIAPTYGNGENIAKNSSDECGMEVDNNDNAIYFQRLEKVYLNGNKLREVPDMWSKLPQLKHLNIANNELYALPSSWNFVLLDPTKNIVKGVFTIDANSHPNSPGNKLDVNIFGNPVLS